MILRSLLAVLLTIGAASAATIAPGDDAAPHWSERTHVLLGHVTTQTVEWYDARMLMTTYTIDIDETFRGNASEPLSIVLPGGTWNGWTQEAVGIPLLDVGARVLVITDDREQLSASGLHRVQGQRILASTLASGAPLPADVQQLRRAFSGTSPPARLPAARAPR